MGVQRLRHKLVLVFLAATLPPLGATLWMGSALMQRSLAFVSTGDTGRLAASLEYVAREYYQQARERLKADAAAGGVEPQRLTAAARSDWPAWVLQFSESADPERFVLSEPSGDRLHYLVRRGEDVWLYTRALDGVRMNEVARQLQQARSHEGDLEQRDLTRGFTMALALVSAVVWVLSLAGVVYMANRISRPIDDLTAGLHRLAAGAFETRLDAAHDEVGRAVRAFNDTAAQLQQNRERLVYLTQVASWQMLARKMAHELKNSLTPIRLTVEEILGARSRPRTGPFWIRLPRSSPTRWAAWNAACAPSRTSQRSLRSIRRRCRSTGCSTSASNFCGLPIPTSRTPSNRSRGFRRHGRTPTR